MQIFKDSSVQLPPVFETMLEETEILSANTDQIDEGWAVAITKWFLPPDKTGCVRPHQKLIILDLGSMMQNKNLTNKGMMLIPSAWIQLIFTWFHELAHVEQITVEPYILAYDTLPAEIEQDADDFAYAKTDEWMAHNPIPELKDMGWLGEMLRLTINVSYARGLDMSDELELLTKGAVARLDYVAIKLNIIQLSKDKYDEDDVVVVDEIPYINARGFLSLITQY